MLPYHCFNNCLLLFVSNRNFLYNQLLCKYSATTALMEQQISTTICCTMLPKCLKINLIQHFGFNHYLLLKIFGAWCYIGDVSLELLYSCCVNMCFDMLINKIKVKFYCVRWVHHWSYYILVYKCIHIECMIENLLYFILY